MMTHDEVVWDCSLDCWRGIVLLTQLVVGLFTLHDQLGMGHT